MMAKTYETVYGELSKQFIDGNKYDSTIIAFSAVPGSGKTELTKRLSSEYGYFRVANKDIRSTIAKLGQTENIDITDYTPWLLDKLIEHKTRNIVFDRNIDQLYEVVKNWSDKNNYRMIVVAIDVSRIKLEDRLLKREGNRNTKAFSMLDFYSDQHAAMRTIIKPDISLIDDYDLDQAAKMIADL